MHSNDRALSTRAGAWCSGEPSGDGASTSARARSKFGGTCYADAPCADAFAQVCERE